jgi:phosphatidylserine decarboxylase
VPAAGLAPLRQPKGAELGRFNMGSTVILLYGRDAVDWAPSMLPGQTLRMGEAIGTLRTVAAPGSGVA